MPRAVKFRLAANKTIRSPKSLNKQLLRYRVPSPYPRYPDCPAEMVTVKNASFPCKHKYGVFDTATEWQRFSRTLRRTQRAQSKRWNAILGRSRTSGKIQRPFGAQRKKCNQTTLF